MGEIEGGDRLGEGGVGIAPGGGAAKIQSDPSSQPTATFNLRELGVRPSIFPSAPRKTTVFTATIADTDPLLFLSHSGRSSSRLDCVLGRRSRRDMSGNANTVVSVKAAGAP